MLDSTAVAFATKLVPTKPTSSSTWSQNISHTLSHTAARSVRKLLEPTEHLKPTKVPSIETNKEILLYRCYLALPETSDLLHYQGNKVCKMLKLD